MLRKIISGGQTGADQGALEGALLAGVATGGWATRGFLTEVGTNWDLRDKYHLQEAPTFDYPERTKLNVRDSDGTLLLGLADSPGSRLTATLCSELVRPIYRCAWPSAEEVRKVIQWILTNEIRVLNVAGNRESKNPGIFAAARDLTIKICGGARHA